MINNFTKIKMFLMITTITTVFNSCFPNKYVDSNSLNNQELASMISSIIDQKEKKNNAKIENPGKETPEKKKPDNKFEEGKIKSTIELWSKIFFVVSTFYAFIKCFLFSSNNAPDNTFDYISAQPNNNELIRSHNNKHISALSTNNKLIRLHSNNKHARTKKNIMDKRVGN